MCVRSQALDVTYRHGDTLRNKTMVIVNGPSNSVFFAGVFSIVLALKL